MSSTEKLEYQIKALEKKLSRGEVKNPFPVMNQVKKLKEKLLKEEKEKSWQEFLSR